jgi:hypothetical protein
MAKQDPKPTAVVEELTVDETETSSNAPKIAGLIAAGFAAVAVAAVIFVRKKTSAEETVSDETPIEESPAA